MVFDSFFFIFIFLPVLLVGWFGLNRVSARSAEIFLIGMSLWFYGCFGLGCLLVLLLSIALNYLFGRGITGRRGQLAAGIAANLLLLAWFKYVTPAVSSAAGDDAALPTFLTLTLPVGLSFYLFTQICYLIDRYRGTVPQEPFLTYLLYASYFPKLAEGPITCYDEIMTQLRDPALRKVNGENVTRGFILFFLGMGKKLLIADTLAPAATYGFASAYYLDTLSVILTLCCYALQLYFDFAGFCDMAMGVSMMLNIRLPLNFDAPFRSTSFSEFWKRWHMTLTRFFTRNVYIPLGGSRKGTLRTWINVMIVFLLSALWHGTGLTYVAWGVMTGVLVIISRQWQKRPSKYDSSPMPSAAGGPVAAERGAAPRREPSASSAGAGRPSGPGALRTAWRRAWNFILFSLTLIFFGAPSLEYSIVIFKKLLVPRFPGWLYRMAGQLDAAEFWLVNKAVSVLAPALTNPAALAELLLVLAVAFVLVFQKKTALQLAESAELRPKTAVLIGILAVWCLTSMSGVSTYLYFQF